MTVKQTTVLDHPDRLTRLQALSRADHMVWQAIEALGPDARPSEIAAAAGLSQTQVVNSIKHLVKQEFVRVERIGTCNRYHLLDQVEEQVKDQVYTGVCQEDTSSLRKSNDVIITKTEKIKEKEVILSITIPVEIARDPAQLQQIAQVVLQTREPVVTEPIQLEAVTIIPTEAVQPATEPPAPAIATPSTETVTTEPDQVKKRRPKRQKPAAETGQMVLLENTKTQDLKQLDIDPQTLQDLKDLQVDQYQTQPFRRGKPHPLCLKYTPAEILMYHDSDGAIATNLATWAEAWRKVNLT